MRPSKLGFLELYNYEECAQKLSNFITYEELDPPDEFPQCIPSSANVTKWQKGDCFDMAILLCSLLIGVGYNAYVVYGIAPKEITTKNEALMECDFLDALREQPEGPADSQVKTETDSIFQKRINESAYDKGLIEKQQEDIKELERKALTIDDDEADELAPDLYLGKRIHAWVLLKNNGKENKRAVPKDLFIEPSTGKIYDTKQSPYLMVDAIFNNKNFYIHMQLKHKVEEIKFELSASITWEYVMLEETADMDDNLVDPQEELENSNKIGSEEDKLKYFAETLDMPPPWAPKIHIEKDKFIQGTPLGENTTFFIKVKIEKYA